MPSMWPARLRANLSLEAPPHPPLVRTALLLGWAHQAATSPLGHPQHPPKVLLVLGLSDQRPLHFPLVQDPRPQGRDSDCRPEGSTLAKNSLVLSPPTSPNPPKSGPQHLLGRACDLPSSTRPTFPRPLASATREVVAAMGAFLYPSREKPQGLLRVGRGRMWQDKSLIPYLNSSIGEAGETKTSVHSVHLLPWLLLSLKT